MFGVESLDNSVQKPEHAAILVSVSTHIPPVSTRLWEQCGEPHSSPMKLGPKTSTFSALHAQTAGFKNRKGSRSDGPSAPEVCKGVTVPAGVHLQL